MKCTVSLKYSIGGGGGNVPLTRAAYADKLNIDYTVQCAVLYLYSYILYNK